MKVRNKISQMEWFSNAFNTHGLSEIIVNSIEQGGDSVYIKDFDIYLEAKQEWKDMAQAFKDHDLVTDNYNTCFFEPRNKEERIRGYAL